MSVLLWTRVVLMLLGAIMLLTGVGDPIIWIGVLIVGMASFVIGAGGFPRACLWRPALVDRQISLRLTLLS